MFSIHYVALSTCLPDNLDFQVKVKLEKKLKLWGNLILLMSCSSAAIPNEQNNDWHEDCVHA